MKNWKRLLYLKIARKLSKNDNSIPVPTIISASTTIKGDIITDGILQIDGRVEGDVTCSELVIGLKGNLIGSAKVRDLQLYGIVKGRITADNLFVSKTAKLIGDASHNSIAIEPGAYIDGHCMRTNTKVTAIAQADSVHENIEEKGKVVSLEKSRSKKKVG
ncbi:MAG: polymer-forming cytoskeletal protein [Alphaproteobacteria bacterium]|nr:polymer-forming cytoskeletal protein [Alphaproteobacteria bacterium]